MKNRLAIHLVLFAVTLWWSATQARAQDWWQIGFDQACRNAVASGALTIANVDNLRLDGNTVSTTNTNGNLNLTPNGTGDTVVTGRLFASDSGLAAILNVEAGSPYFEASSNVPAGGAGASISITTAATQALHGNASLYVANGFGVTIGRLLLLEQRATPPVTCDSSVAGGLYHDTSPALCWCNGTAWTVVTGTSCS